MATLVSETADKICAGKLVDFVGSGYNSSLQIVSLGWLASIAGITGIEIVSVHQRQGGFKFRPEHRERYPAHGTSLEGTCYDNTWKL